MSGGSTFCPECGSENPEGLSHCMSCNHALDPVFGGPADQVTHRPMRWPVFGMMAGIAGAVVLLAWLIGLTVPLQIFEVMRFDPQKGDFVAMEVMGGAATTTHVFGTIAGFGVAGLVTAVTFQGRYLREVAAGGAAAMGLLALLWFGTLFARGGSLQYELWVEGDGFALRGPGAILLAQLLLLHLFAALTMAFASWIALEQLTKKTRCVHCHAQYALVPSPPRRCPKCGAPQQRDGVQWGFVMIGAALTGGVFWLLNGPLGATTGTFVTCDAADMTDACRAARQAAGATTFRVADPDGDARLLQVFNLRRHLAVNAGLMLAAPLALSLAVPRGSRASAGAMIVVNWLLCTFVLLQMRAEVAAVDGGFVFLLRNQLLALIAWGVAGFVGAMIGDRLRFRRGSAYLDEIAD